MVLLKIIFLQLFWFLVVVYGKSVPAILTLFIGICFIIGDYFFFKLKVSLGRYLFLTAIMVLIGYLNDSSLMWFNLIQDGSYHYGNLSLWIIFIAYYEHIFMKFRQLSNMALAFVGSVAGALTYWSAAKLGAVVVNPGHESHYILSQLLFWAIFFPVSLKLYFNDSCWDWFLDKTVFFSFDKSGFYRHQKKFTENLETKNLKGKTILVTGATAGIGREVATMLGTLGARVLITGRSHKKAEDFLKNNPEAHFISIDMSNWTELCRFARECTVFDHVVFNAGSMPEKLSVNDSGIEFQCASQLMGHYYLMRWLKEFRKIRPGAKIVWVSSGGMYLKKLDLNSLFHNSQYEKVQTYANVKRAQVTLVEELAKNREWSDFNIYSMHPGWVGTDGLKEALPQFYKFMEKRLRDTKEGADTILWCLLSETPLKSGGFFFDRKKVSPYISHKYSPSSHERTELLKVLEKFRPYKDYQN